MNSYQAQPWVKTFSPRELEVLQFISDGLSNREIAQKLYLSIETIKWYNKQMFMKLGVKNRTQAANKAVKLHLLNPKQDFQKQERIPIAGNLPSQLTSYVGREKEIGEIKKLLRNNRLVVLTGAGGSGKTRLALKVAEELQVAYRDGVWLVELANIRDPSLVLGAITNVLNLTGRANAPLDEVLKRFLSRRQLLLLIDNLEHLLECTPMIGELLATAPQLSVLGTSRERLHIYGEQEYPVQPLNLPDPKRKISIENISKIDAIALFVRRAHAVYPTLSLDDEALQDLARICVHLDGLPLAIELCAPMVKMFPLGVIADRIEESMDVIPSGPRDLPARQQTLRDTIQWSYDLLAENEKSLFERLAIFNGGGTLQAVEAICGNGISSNIRNDLFALVSKNLVLAQERQDGEIHFGMLETIRQYARDKLLASKKNEQLAERHARYFMEQAKQGSVELRGPGQIIWTNRFISMHDNLRTALEWLINEGETEAALQFVNDLFEFWLRHSDYEEASQWHSRILALPDARQYPEAYLEAFNHLTWVHWLQTKRKEAISLAERALVLSQSQTSKINTAVALLNLGLTMLFRNDDKAQVYLEKAKEICQEHQYGWELARAHQLLGVAHKNQGQYTSARSHFLEAFNLWKKLGDIGFHCMAQRLVGDLEIEQGNLKEAVNDYCEALLIARDVKNRWIAAGIIRGLADAAKAEERYERALRLYLASKKIFDDIGAWGGSDDIWLEEELATACAALSKVEFQSAADAGRSMTMEEAIEFALNDDVGVG